MNVTTFLTGILPSVGLLVICFFVFRGVIRADRNERAAIAEEEARMERERSHDRDASDTIVEAGE